MRCLNELPLLELFFTHNLAAGVVLRRYVVTGTELER